MKIPLYFKCAHKQLRARDISINLSSITLKLFIYLFILFTVYESELRKVFSDSQEVEHLFYQNAGDDEYSSFQKTLHFRHKGSGQQFVSDRCC